MFIVFAKFLKNLQCLFYNIFSALCENNYERPLPLFTPVSPWPPLPRIRIVRPCSTYERFPPMDTHFKLRARHLGVRAPLISADNKGKQKPMPPHTTLESSPQPPPAPHALAFSLAGNVAIRRLWQPVRRMRRPSTSAAEQTSCRGTQLSDAYKSCLR